jgi:ATP-dependent DNA helicase RecQ
MTTAYLSRQTSDREKLDAMMRYGQSAACRWSFILDYFGEGALSSGCGNCDNCCDPLERQMNAPGSAA